MNKILLVFVCFVLNVCVKAQNLPYCLNSTSVITTPTVVGQPNRTISNDFNNDGKTDMVTLNQFSNSFSVLLGTGFGAFASPVNYTLSPSFPREFVTSDFNGDGNLDLAIALTNLGELSIFMGSGSGTFINTNTYTVGSQPNTLAVDDFNGDGISDIAIGHYYGPDISIIIGTGSGTFSTVVNYFAGCFSNCITTGDFNGDGIKDIIASGLSILIGSGTGTFAPYVSLGFGANGIKCGDFNGDGKLDLALFANSIYSFKILIGTGGGSFFLPPVSYTVGFEISSLSLGDYTGDGILDIAAVIGGSYGAAQYVSMYVGSGLGTFSVPINYNLGFLPGNSTEGDFNNDGKLDLVVIDKTSLINLSILFGLGNGHFSKIDSYVVGTGPFSLTSADFNGDGISDLASVDYNSHTVSLLLGIGNGTFLAASTYSVGYFPRSIVSADFNNDGIIDLATANFGSNSVSVLIGSGLGTFTSIINYAVGTDPISLTAGDFNNDGNIDIATANYTSHDISIRLGTGIGSFLSIVNYSVAFPPTSIINNDFNGDSNLDLVVVDINSSGKVTFLGSSTGTFVSSYNSNSMYGVSSLLTKDFNNDGILDLALTHSSSIDSLSILLGSGTGSFTVHNKYKVGAYPNTIDAGDLNGDGILDLVIGYNYPNISIFMGLGAGSFSTAINYISGASSSAVVIRDYNGDGKVDLAFSNYNTNSVSIFINGIPSVSVTGVSTLCLSNSATITATGATTYSWSSGSTTNSIVVSPSSTNTYTVIGTSLYGCINTAIKTITVSALSIPTISINSGSICSGSNFAFIPSGGTTYYYSSGSATVAPSISTTYTVYGLNALGCYGTAISSITVSPSPTLTVNSGNICIGDSFTITPSSAASYTYSSGSAVVSPIVNTTYSVVGTSSLGCVSSNTAISSVTINPTPTVSVNSGLLCSGNSFTMNPTGASTYTYSSGSAVVSPTVYSTYSVVGTSSFGCVSSNTAVSSVTISAAPILSLAGTNSVCIGSSTSYTANGASTYSWSTGAPTPSVSVSPTITTTYSVVGTNTLGCTKTETISILVNNSCQDVWPGDANSDGTADNLDVLELGLHMGQTGVNRSTTSNLWQSYFSNNWVGTITSGKNVNHSDCNGDGTINQNDTLAIYNNYGLTHAFKPSGTTVVDPQLNIISDQSFVEKGKWGTASVYLGDALNPINNVNGVAYTLNYDNSFIETDSVYLDYPISFINAGNQNLHFRKRNFTSSVLYTATTHTTNTNVSGNGKIAIVHFKIKQSLLVDAPLNFSISQVNSSNASGTIIPLTAGSTSVLAVGTSVGLSTYDHLSTVTIFPNPTNGILNIEVNLFNENMSVIIYNALGQPVLTDVFTTKSLKLNTSALANGFYFIDVISHNKTLTRSKFVKE